MDWGQAEEHLNDMIDKYLSQGSLGVSSFMVRVYPLRNRFKDGERTQDLYDAIMRIPEP